MRTPITEQITEHLLQRGMEHLIDAGMLAAYDNGTLAEFLEQRGAMHLVDAGLPALLQAANAEAQYEQCRQWRDLFRDAGYTVYFTYINQRPKSFDRAWSVYRDGHYVGQFDIDGCGASWHGPDSVWIAAVGRHVGVTA